MCRGTLRMRSSTSGFTMPWSRSRWTSRSRVRADVIPMPLRRRSTIEAFQPVRHHVERVVAREVDLQRCHGNEALRHRVEVRTRSGILLWTGGADPVDLSAARIARGHDALGAMSESEPCAAESPQACERHIGDVHVEDECALERAREQLLHERARDLGAGLEVTPGVGLRAE